MIENINNGTQPGRPIIQRAATGGLRMGLYLIGLALATAMSLHSSICAIIVWVGTIYFPIYLYKQLVAGYAETGFSIHLSEIWSEGIATIFLGSAIQAVFIYVGLRYFDPTYISTVWQTTADALGAMPGDDYKAMADTFNQMQEAHALPTAVDVMSQIILMNLIGGAVLSLVDAALVYTRYSDHERRSRYTAKHTNNTTNGI